MHRLFTAARSAGTHARGVLCLLVMLAVFRACIPVGFMPDPAALAQGRWALMLCPSAGGDLPRSLAFLDREKPASLARDEPDDAERGSNAAHVEHNGHLAHASHAEQVAPGERHAPATHLAGIEVKEHTDHDARQAGLDCPYSIVTNLALDLPPPVLALALLRGDNPALTANVPQSRPPLPPAGPPLGSRAPPSLQA